jgi:hypothetical protein
MSALLMLASELYSLPILRPVAAVARARGHRVAWLATPAIAAALHPDEIRLCSRRALDDFGTDAVYSTVHRIPPQLPGRHVQLFHGLSTDKREPTRGHFRIRGLFDLYCTHGPATTTTFIDLARQHRHFAVAETGWPKLDPLFAGALATDAMQAPALGRPIVLFASTFTESLSAAGWIADALGALVARGDRYWLLTLHPKVSPDLTARYRAMAGPNAAFVSAERVPEALQAADALVCDTSSVVEEFALLGKPIVTLRHRRPKACMLDIGEPDALDAAVTTALSRQAAMLEAIRTYADHIHPLRDGRASERVLDATEKLLSGGFGALRARPRNLWRRLISRRQYAAWFVG